MINQILEIRNKVKTTSPLIHCITNPISINDCANAVLSVGAKPIMAEHPKEVAQITKTSSSLAVNLGNITDVRMESMMISGKVALDIKIPCIIDIVGVGCSNLRLEFAERFITQNKPNVIKGNMSEIKVLAGLSANSIGIDVGSDDEITPETIDYNLQVMKQLSEKTSAIIVATGKTDIIVFEGKGYLIDNGVRMLSEITGTGCMLNVLIASFLSTKECLKATVLATAMLGISGELAQTNKGTGSFRVNLLDNLNTITNMQIQERLKLTEVKI